MHRLCANSRSPTTGLKVDLSIKCTTNPVGDVDAKDAYSLFSQVAEYVFDSGQFYEKGLTALHFSYIFVNTEHSRDWALHKASAETVSKFSMLTEVLLRDSTNGLVCVTPMLSERSP